MTERKVYLLLTDTGTLFTRMIKLYTKKPYNHSSIGFDHQLLEVYSFGRKRPKNPFIGGFIKENTQTGLFKQAKCAIYSCTITEDQFQKMNDFIREIEEQNHNYRYNLLGLFAIALNKNIQRKRAFFCSQFVATVLQKSEIIDFRKPISLVTPNDLHESPLFQLVYQGNLVNYLYGSKIQLDTDLDSSLINRIGFLFKRTWSI
jgi:hypothetical protein